MKANVMEHRPHTEIVLADDSIGIMIDITDKDVCIDIDNNETHISFMIDHITAADISRKVANIIDDRRW